MDEELKGKFKAAVQNCLHIIEPLAEKCKAPFLVWKRGDWYSWGSEWIEKPEFAQIFIDAESELSEASKVFSDSFSAMHGEYGRQVWLGGEGRSYSGTDFVWSSLEYLWRKNASFSIVASAIDQIADDFEASIDSPEVRFTCQAQLANFDMKSSSIDLPDGVTIRRLSDDEVSAICGGSMTDLSSPLRDDLGGLHDFCIETGAEEIKRFGGPDGAGTAGLLEMKSRFNKAILSLRTYQDGAVGYGRVRCHSTTFCPLLPWSYGWGDAYVPYGRYSLESKDVSHFLEHAKHIFQLSESSMTMACSRLADSRTRTNVNDRIVDAVIGMEALLLAGLEDRRGELRYRFSLHNSSLFDSQVERYRAFGFAKDLYDLRSAVAHGSNLSKKQSDGLIEMAGRATEALRQLIHKFLPLAPNAPYRKPQFWERRYFGLPDSS